MVEVKQEQQETALRKYFGSFLSARPKYHRSLMEVLEIIQHLDGDCYVFGGLLRDLMAYGANVMPRDIDIVFDNIPSKTIQDQLHAFTKRRTRFGGLHLNNQVWLFDVWPLAETWAFRQNLVKAADFSELPKTSFLNVEAVVIELFPKGKKPRQIYSHCFFEAMANRVLEINLEENPFPALCVVRSLLAAVRLQFTIGPRLSKYLAHYLKLVSIEELLEVQRHHYGQIRCDMDQIQVWHSTINEQRRLSKTAPVVLPFIKQLTLWDESSLSR